MKKLFDSFLIKTSFWKNWEESEKRKQNVLKKNTKNKRINFFSF